MAYNSTSWVTSGTTAAVTSKGATLYAHFGTDATNSGDWDADKHYPIPFFSNSLGTSLQEDITFGTSTEPATTFTTADVTNTDSALLVPFMWYVPDNISIDGITSIEGKQTSATATTRMHLFSYTFTSGSTSALTSGTLIAHNSDVTNEGSEQVYLSTWTIDSASVAAGKVLLAFFRVDTATDDYSISITVKYHLS